MFKSEAALSRTLFIAFFAALIAFFYVDGAEFANGLTAFANSQEANLGEKIADPVIKRTGFDQSMNSVRTFDPRD